MSSCPEERKLVEQGEIVAEIANPRCSFTQARCTSSPSSTRGKASGPNTAHPIPCEALTWSRARDARGHLVHGEHGRAQFREPHRGWGIRGSRRGARVTGLALVSFCFCVPLLSFPWHHPTSNIFCSMCPFPPSFLPFSFPPSLPSCTRYRHTETSTKPSLTRLRLRLFILEGVASAVTALAGLWLLPDTNETTQWLSEDERRIGRARMERDRLTGTQEHAPVMEALWSAARDRRLWLFCAIQNTHYAATSFINFLPT